MMTNKLISKLGEVDAIVFRHYIYSSNFSSIMGD